MTDINELAQRMKAAALKAIADEGPTWFSKDQLSHPEGIALHEADVEFIALASHENVLALVEALEAKGKQIDILRQDKDTVIDTSLERINKILSRAEAAEERIAELSELPMKSDVEKKPQNTLSGRPVYLGDGSDAKETLIAGKRDIHRYGSLITDKAWKGD